MEVEEPYYGVPNYNFFKDCDVLSLGISFVPLYNEGNNSFCVSPCYRDYLVHVNKVQSAVGKEGKKTNYRISNLLCSFCNAINPKKKHVLFHAFDHIFYILKKERKLN